MREPYIARVLAAQRINQALGGFAVAPWEIDDFPVEWRMAIDALTVDLPGMRQSRAEVERKMEEWRQRHPAYKKKN